VVWGARYTLGARYLYMKRNVENVWGARYTSARVIYRKIRYSDIKFRKNPSSGSRVVPFGRTDTTDLRLTSHNFANEPKKKVPEYNKKTVEFIPSNVVRSCHGFCLVQDIRTLNVVRLPCVLR
jgi:hypothetical protein